MQYLLHKDAGEGMWFDKEQKAREYFKENKLIKTINTEYGNE